MSTKIYNAYICKLGMPYLQLIIQALREEYTDQVREIIKSVPNTLRRACIDQYDDDALVIYPLKNGDILFQEWRYKLGNRPGYLPTFGLMLTFNKIQDYHYQDQSDPWYAYEFDEDKITQEEHDAAEIEYVQRQTDWEEVFDKAGSWTPSEVGYTIPYITDKVRLDWERE